MGRAPCCDKGSVKKGPWSPEEDRKLKYFIHKYGTAGNWIALPQKAGLKRCGKSCRLRWLNYLRPNIKHGDFSEHEDSLICSLFATIGSRWSMIAAQLPGRTDNDIKNYWNTKLKKKLMLMAGLPPTQHHPLSAAAAPPFLGTAPPLSLQHLGAAPQAQYSSSNSFSSLIPTVTAPGLLMFGSEQMVCSNNDVTGSGGFIFGDGGLQLQGQDDTSTPFPTAGHDHGTTASASLSLLLDHHPHYRSSSSNINSVVASCYEYEYEHKHEMKPLQLIAPGSSSSLQLFYGGGETAAGAIRGRFLY